MDYEIIDQYLVYRELRMDAFGKNFRARRMVNDKPTDRKIVVEIHPFISEDIVSMGHLRKHFDEIKKSDIENLLVPENIFQHQDQTFWVYPHIKGKSLKEIIEDSEKKNLPLSFELAISMALKCSILLDIGSMIILDKGSSSHGFLTPDNIIITTGGEIYLKYYGLLGGIDRNNRIFSEIKSKYHEWVTPEFLASEEVLQQSDFYYLGHMVYRILTGKYFSILPGVDFETAITSISFTHNIPSTDTEFLTNIIEFFRKTLNPDISRRFANINEFNNFISKYFCVSDSMSISSTIVEYMDSLYSGDIEEEKTVPIAEISAPEKKPVPEPPSAPEIIEDIPRKLQHGKRSPFGAILLISVLIIVSGFLLYKFVLNPSPDKSEIIRENKREAAPTQVTAVQPAVSEDGESRDSQSARSESQNTAEVTSEPAEKPAEESDRNRVPEKEKNIPTPTARKDIQPAKTETTAVVPRGIPQIPLKEVHKKPMKVSGTDPEFEFNINQKYPQLPQTIYVNALIDERGGIEKVNILNQIPNELQLVLKGTLYKWKFTPARKNNRIVKVWIPISIPLKCREKPQTPETEKPAPRTVPTISNSEADIKPVEVSCPTITFSETLKRNYMGRRARVQGSLLIDQTGKVIKVNITSHIPDDLKAYIEEALRAWTFMPGKKNGKNVKVWFPVSFKIHIR